MHSNMRKFAIIFLTASRNESLLKCLFFLHLVQTSETFENYFIHNWKRSLSRVLLHNGNTTGSVPLGYLIPLRQQYNEIKFVLE